MLADGRYQHPYYWAAFELTGDPGVGKKAQPVLAATAEVRSTAAPAAESTGRAGICGVPLFPLIFVVWVSYK